MRKINLIAILVIVMTLITSTTVFAGNTTSIKVNVNNKGVKYSAKPYMQGKEVMIPLKQTAEAFGAKVELDKKNKTVWVNLGMMHLEFRIGKSEFYIHRDADFSGIPQTIKLNAPLKNIKGRMFVPGKNVFENIGMIVSWESKKRVLSITDNNSTGVDLSKDIAYTEIMIDDISGIKDVYKWYNENNQKQGISYIRDDKYFYVLIGAGKRSSGGFTISIDNIFYSTKDAVTINARVTPPGDNVSFITVITYPSTLIRIESDSIKTAIGEVIDMKTPTKEKWIILDSNTVTKMELFTLEQVKLRDIAGTEKDDIMKSFNEATLDPNGYIKMIAGGILKVTTNDGYVLTFTSYGSDTNVIVNFEKDGETRSFHLIAPVIAKALLTV